MKHHAVPGSRVSTAISKRLGPTFKELHSDRSRTGTSRLSAYASDRGVLGIRPAAIDRTERTYDRSGSMLLKKAS